MKSPSSVCIITATATFLAAMAASTEVSFAPPRGTRVVEKTIVSARMRLVFAMGLEGTGHHYVAQVEDHLFQTHPNLVRVSRRDSAKPQSYTIKHAMGEDAQHYSTMLSGARETMRQLADIGAGLQSPGTVVLMPGRNSYPDGPGPKKVLKYMDLRVLAEVAEEEGVDLRILYLRRPVKDTLIANTVHRKFQNRLHTEGRWTPETTYMQYMQVLMTDIAVMHSFLAELGPGFVACHDFGQVAAADQTAAISGFLAPSRELAALLNDSFIEVARSAHAKPEASLLYEGADVVAERLQRKFDTFESQICSAM